MRAVNCKSVLTKSKLPKVDYCCNIYVGCTHSCRYCYANFMRRFTGHANDEWGTFVDYKENSIEVLEREVKKIEKDKWVLLGSVTDTYQPIEKKLGLTRKCLEVFLKYQIPVSILTKSDIVMRDIDLLKQIINCEVGLSCSFVDEKIASKLEPYASSPQKRILSLRKLKDAGIKTYLFIGPIIPGLTNLEDVFSATARDVDFVMAESLNLKCGSINNLMESISLIVGKDKAIEIINQCKDDKYWICVENKVNELCKLYNIENRGFFHHYR